MMGYPNMRIDSEAGAIELVDEPLDSSTHLQKYRFAKELAPGYRPSSIRGLWLKGEPIAVFSNAGGANRAYANSAVYVDGLLYIAVGNNVVCVCLDPFKYEWSLEVDWATCFGIHFNAEHQALISHGELAIARISKSGAILWSSGGADIFTGEFALLPQFIEAIDFNGKTYRFNYDDGEPIG